MRTKLGIGISALVVAGFAVSGMAAATATPVTAKLPATGRPSTALTANTVSASQARQLALTAVPGGKVVEIETDDLADRAVWKVTVAVGNGRVRVFVDAVTGAVTFERPAGDRRDGATPDPRESAEPQPAETDEPGEHAGRVDDPAGHDAAYDAAYGAGGDRGRGDDGNRGRDDGDGGRHGDDGPGHR